MRPENARERILARLKASGAQQVELPEEPILPELTIDQETGITRLCERMAAVETEVHIVAADRWVDTLKALAREKGWKQLLYGPASPIGSEVQRAWPSDAEGLPALVAYTDAVETFKEALFQIDAGITGTRGGLADTGAVVLWPSENEPRLISLVPPVHVAVLDADQIYTSLAEIMAAQQWADAMPTNALLISGPSKTADIEFTLVFGVHGPKELVLLIRK